jgi:hypothetical protein
MTTQFNKLLTVPVFTLGVLLFNASSAYATDFTPKTATAEEVASHLQEIIPAPQYQKDAASQAKAFVTDQGLALGWNEDRKQMIVIGSASFDSEDPSYDKSYITKRTLKTMEATLDAKSKIIGYISTTMSAFDKATTPGTDLNAQFKEEVEMIEAKINAQRNKVAKYLKDFDAKESDSLRGVDIGDRMDSMMDAAIKKLDDQYSTEKIEEKKREKYEKAKHRYAEAQKEYAQLKQKLAATKGSIQETLSSKVETLSRQPLFGATTVAQFESWSEDTEQYTVSLVVLWGTKMEKVARAMIQGTVQKVPPGKKSLQAWVDDNDWATSVGGRRFRDDKGDVHFVGIAASRAGKSSTSKKRARGLAEEFAQQGVAMAIFADVDSHKTAEAIMQTRSAGDDKDSSIAAESFSSEVLEKIEERVLRGLQPIYGDFVTHPISQHKIYVAIYSMSGTTAAQAMQMQERNYLTRMLDVKSQQRMHAQDNAMKGSVDAAKRDRSTYNKQYRETSKDIRGQSSAEDAAARQGSTNKPKSPSENRDSEESYEQEGGNSRSGTYSGGGQSDALDW